MSIHFENDARKKRITEDELLKIFSEIPSESEDDMEIDEDDCLSDEEERNTGKVVDNELLENLLGNEDLLELQCDEKENTNFTNNASPEIQNDLKALKKSLRWKRKNLVIPENQLNFIGSTDLPTTVKQLSTPYQFFRYFFDEENLEKIVYETNLYARSKNIENTSKIMKYDILKYLGILVISSVAKYPNVRLFWDKDIGLDMIQNTMPLNAFEKLRSVLHFNDNSKIITDKTSPEFDKLFKIRPIVEAFRKKCLSIPMEEHLSVDEQICASKSRHHLKQYLPLKPHKWGYKFFVLCGVSGFAYNFEIYSGLENNTAERLKFNEVDLGASSNIVVRLCREIPRSCNYKIYFDNYYTSIQLQHYLAQQGIHSLGTVRRNRIPNCKLPTDGNMKKETRGTSIEYVADFQGVEISNLAWKDNKCVNMLSTFVGTQPEGAVNRFDRKTKSNISIKCPAVIKEYNRHMGGVDLMDSFIGRSKISMKSRKWYMRLFYHIIDMSVINSWLLYKRLGSGPQMNLVQYRIELSRTLCNIGVYSSKRGRPSASPSVASQYLAKKKRGPTISIPTIDVRHDGINHIPIWNDIRIRCKYPSCTSKTYVTCRKCGVALCLNKDKNCFLKFHEN